MFKSQFSLLFRSLDCCEGVGHILHQQSAKPVNFPPPRNSPTTIRFSERTPRRGHCLSSAAGPGPPAAACAPHPVPARKTGSLLPGACPPRLGRWLAATTQTALPPEGIVPIQLRCDPRPRLQLKPYRGCLGVQLGPPLALGRPRTFQPSAHGRRTPNPRTAPTASGGERAPGCPPAPARSALPRPAPSPARGPPAAGARGPSRSRAPGGLLRAAMPAARCGRARSLPRRSVRRRGRPPGAGDRFPAAGRLARRRVWTAVPAPAPGARGPTDALGRQ